MYETTSASLGPTNPKYLLLIYQVTRNIKNTLPPPSPLRKLIMYVYDQTTENVTQTARVYPSPYLR